jgi:uncharacterized glyoxalase superfamily protein PhnB
MLIVPDTPRAVEWYKRALGAAELWDLGTVAGLQIGGAPFFLHESRPEAEFESDPGAAGTTTTRIELFVEDPDEVIDQALEAGAVPDPGRAADHALPWGNHRQGGFRDPFGHRWSVGDSSPLARYDV